MVPTLGEPNPRLLKTLQRADWVEDVIVTREKPLGVARKNALVRAETEFVAMIDGDVVIPENWFSLVEKYLGFGVGAVATVAIQRNSHLDAYNRVVSCFVGLSEVSTSPHINNVVVRRKIFLNYSPPCLFFGEDFHFRKHVLDGGFRWIVLPCVGAVHLGESKNHFVLGVSYRRYRHYSWRQFLRRCLSKFLFIPFASLINLSFSTFFYLSKMNVEFLSGWIRESINDLEVKK